MNHADFERHLADYLEGDLPLGKRALVDAHLDECEACSAELAELQDTISLLRSLPDPDVPANFTANVMRRVRAGEARPTLVNHLQNALTALFSPRVLYPVSLAMVVAGVLLATGQVRVGPPFQRLVQPTQVVVHGPATSPMAEARTEQRIAHEASGAGTLVGARSADGLMDEASSIYASSPTVPYRHELGAGDRYDDPAATARATARQPVPRVIEQYLASSRAPIPRRDLDSGVVLTRPASTYGASPRDLYPGGYGGGQGTVVVGRSEAPLALRRDPSAGAALPSPEEWLEFVTVDPDRFAAHLEGMSLAEHEGWVDNLARHATDRGRLEEVVNALRQSHNPNTRLLADDFTAAAERYRARESQGSSARD